MVDVALEVRESEQALLGACLLGADLAEVTSILRPEMLYGASPDHRAIMTGIIEVAAAGAIPEPITVAEHLERHGLLDRAGGISYLVDLQCGSMAPANARHHAGIVRDAYLRRRLREVLREVAIAAVDPDQTVADLLSRAEAGISLLAQQVAPRTARSAFEVAQEVLADLEERRRNPGLRGLQTGLRDFDAHTGGLPVGLNILAARPAMGKTALGLQMARHAVLTTGLPSLYCSLEMPAEQLIGRLLAAHARVPVSVLARGGHNASDQARMREVLDHPDLPGLMIDDDFSATTTDILARARTLRAKRGLSCVVVDYLGLVDEHAEKTVSTRNDLIGQITRRLKQASRDLGIPIVALCQLSRASERRADHTPMLSDLRDSGNIEQDADTVIFLHRPEEYGDEKRIGEADLIVAKGRNIATGTVTVAFRKPITTFADLARRESPKKEARGEW